MRAEKSSFLSVYFEVSPQDRLISYQWNTVKSRSLCGLRTLGFVQVYLPSIGLAVNQPIPCLTGLVNYTESEARLF